MTPDTHTHTLRWCIRSVCTECDGPPLDKVTIKTRSCYINFIVHYLLPDINFALRKIVCLLKPTKEITHDPATGAMKIRTLTTFKNFDMDFTIGKEFTEDLGPVDGRTCQVCCCCLF